MKDTAKLPRFKYHPNLYENGIVVFKNGICQCCGEKVDAYIESMYCEEEVDCICLHCIANGKAAEKFHGDFIRKFLWSMKREKSMTVFKSILSKMVLCVDIYFDVYIAGNIIYG